mmetsp:Transcript_10235/g.20031  ORF Transcript_10235/g.20031 Transcript_10235/m.20031 type:complete len:97 (-) Transcript_10235:31-321(-)
MVRQIAPNVGVLYATILALTLEVLYSRVTRIQENSAIEAMLLSQITRNLLSLFVNESEWAIEACQIVANQIVIMLWYGVVEHYASGHLFWHIVFSR